MIPTFYSDKMVVDELNSYSPSAGKPRIVAHALHDLQRTMPKLGIKFYEPEPVSIESICRVHDESHVRSILALSKNDGFEKKNANVARSLPYTSGAMLSAARFALHARTHAAALCSGFHHASYDVAKWFCTFNGLMISAAELLHTGEARRIAIIDADQHYGDGTQSILDDAKRGKIPGLQPETCDRIFHYSFGQDFEEPAHARLYLARARELGDELAKFSPDVVIYQAGADAHCDDPLGGVLTTEELVDRDMTIIGACTKLGIPVAWNLAGGYKRDVSGGISGVVKIHTNTFFAAWLKSLQ